METRTVHYRARVKKEGEFDTFKESYLTRAKSNGQIYVMPAFQAHWCARQLAKEHQTEARVVKGVVPETVYRWDQTKKEVVEVAITPPDAPPTSFNRYFRERDIGSGDEEAPGYGG